MRLSDLERRAVGIWGFGSEGASLYSALRRAGSRAPITVFDERPLPRDVLDRLSADGRTKVRTGDDALTALAEVEVVVKSPGVSAYRPEIAAARAAGTAFTSATQIWFDESPGQTVVAITGTKGKSTTATLVAHLLAAAGKRVELAGNIGTPLADYLAVEVTAEVWVVELSSYQTHGLVASPRLAVLLNLFPEHLDWHGDARRYYLDKLSLFGGLAPGAAIVDRRDPITANHLEHFAEPVFFNDPSGLHVEDGQVMDGRRPLLARSELPLPGAHNASNLCAALTVVRELGVDPAVVVDALGAVQGLPHRLRIVGERDGVTWVDDSISTIPESAIAALAAFSGRPVTILLGGFERGLEMEGLASSVVAAGVHAVVTLPQSGPRIAAAVRAAAADLPGPAPRILEADDLAQAVEVAGRETPPGGVVLLSPAAASYDAFRDHRHRGSEFTRLAGFEVEEG